MKRFYSFLVVILWGVEFVSAQSWTCKQDSVRHSTYNPGDSVWTQDIFYNILTFDSLGNVLTQNAGQDDERTVYQFINTYDTASHLVLQIVQTSSGNVQKDTFAYNANGNKLFDKTFSWSGSSWQPYYTAIYDSFDSHGNPTYETDTNYSVHPNDTTFSRYVYTYDLNGNIASKITQHFNDTLATWFNYSKAVFSVNGNDSIETDYGWRFTDSTWVVGERYDSYWKDICASGIKQISQNTVSIYPNPFTDKLFIEPKVSFVLVDLTGRDVYNSTMQNSLSQLATGTYILQSQYGNVRLTKK